MCKVPDVEFLCTGFLKLIKEFAEKCNNPLSSLIIEEVDCIWIWYKIITFFKYSYYIFII